jgi:hypothetical protein
MTGFVMRRCRRSPPGVLGLDDVSLVVGSRSSTEDVGANKDVAAASLTGADAGNYTVNSLVYDEGRDYGEVGDGQFRFCE